MFGDKPGTVVLFKHQSERPAGLARKKTGKPSRGGSDRAHFSQNGVKTEAVGSIERRFRPAVAVPAGRRFAGPDDGIGIDRRQVCRKARLR